MSKKEKKPMTNAKKSVLITLLVLIVLGVSTAVLLLMPPTDTEPAATDSSQTQSEDESSEEEEDNSISLLSKKASEVDHIDVVNQNTSFTLRPREDSKESSSESSTDESSADTDDLDSAFFSVDGLDPDVYPVLDTAVNSAAKYGYTLTAEKLIGDAADYNLDEFGLQDPVVQVTSTFTDGTEFSYAIGNVAASTGYYLLVDGKIYVGSSSEYLRKGLTDFCTTKIVSIDTSTTDPDFDSISITNENLGNSVLTIQDQIRPTNVSAYSITSPYSCSGNDSEIKSLQEALCTVTANTVVKLSPTDEELEKYGLKNPKATVTYTVNGETYTLYAGGKDEDGNRYLMVKGGHVVYTIASSSISDWADATVLSLREKFVLLVTITDIETITVDQDDGEHVFSMSRTENEESTTEESTVYDYTVKGTDGQDLTYKTFQQYYQLLVGEQLLGETGFSLDDVKGKDPDITVTYEYYDQVYDTDVIQYYKLNDRRYLAVVNGQAAGLVTSTSINSIQQATKEMEEDAYES